MTLRQAPRTAWAQPLRWACARTILLCLGLLATVCARGDEVTFTHVPVPDGIQVAEYFDSAQQHRLQPQGSSPSTHFSQLVQRFALVTLEARTHTDARGAHYDARVVLARQWRGLGEPRAKNSPVAGKRYVFTVVGNDIVALNEKDSEAPPKQLGLAATLFKKPDFVAELGAFLHGKTLQVGDELTPPTSLSIRLTGLPNTRMTLRSLQARWQRDVAVFELSVAGASARTGILTSDASAHGELLVDIATARPLQVTSRGALTGRGPTRSASNVFTHAGFSVRTRALSYADVPLFGQGIDLVVPNAPAGIVAGLALSGDGTGLLMSSTTGANDDAHRIALWDRAAARQASSTAATVGPHIVAAPDAAMLLNYDDTANAVALSTVGAQVEHFGRFLRPSQPGATAFGALGVYGLIGNSAGEARIYNFGHDQGLVHKVSEVPLIAVHGTSAARALVTVDADGVLRRFPITVNPACGTRAFASYCDEPPFTLPREPDLERKLPVARTLPAGTASASSSDGNWLALASPDPTGAPVSTLLVHLGQAATAPVRIPGDLPAFSDAHLVTSAGLFTLDGKLVRSFDDFDMPAKITRLAVTRDARTVFVASADVVHEFDMASGVRVREIRSQVPAVKRVAWLDGALVAVHASGFSALEFATSTLTHTELGDIADVQFARAAASGAVIAVRGLFAGVFVIHAGEGAKAKVQPVRDGLASGMQLSTNGRYVAVQVGAQLHVHTTSDGERQFTITGTAQAQAFAVTDAGELLVIHDGRLERFDTNGQRMAQRTLVTDKTGFAMWPKLALSPDGSTLALAALAGEQEAGWNASIPVVKLLDAVSLEVSSDLYPTWGQIDTLAFSADGRTISAGLGNGDLVSWDTRTGMRLARWHAHEDGVSALVALDGARMLSAGRDGLIRVWDTALAMPAMPVTGLGQRLLDKVLMFARRKPHLIASAMFLRGQDYAITTPDGYFSASKSALTQLAFKRQLGGLSTFEQFDLWLHRPDVVLQRMRAVSPTRQRVLKLAHAKRLKRHGASGTSSSAQPFWSVAQPSLALRTPPGGRTRDASTQVDLQINAGDAPLSELIVSANSVPLVRKKIAGNSWQGRVEVPLLSGDNQLQAYVRDTAGLTSARRSWAIHRLNRKPEVRLWIVTVGVSDYQRETIRLRYAAKDASDLAAFFNRAAGEPDSRFSAVETLTLTDAQVTQDLVPTVREFLSDAAPDDQVMVFVSGHGFVGQDATYYFGTWDVDPAAPSRRGLAYDALLGMFDGLEAHRRVLLLDTCHAGELDPEIAASSLPVLAMPGARVNGRRGIGVVKQARAAEPVDLDASFVAMREHFVTLSDRSGANVLAAAGGLEYALESKRWNNGVFSFAIMEGLSDRRADSNGDGVVMLSELRAYVAARVQALTAGGQQPTSRAENIYVDFPVL